MRGWVSDVPVDWSVSGTSPRQTRMERGLFSSLCSFPVSSILCPHSLCESPSRTSHLVQSQCPHWVTVTVSQCQSVQETFRALYAHFRKSAFLQTLPYAFSLSSQRCYTTSHTGIKRKLYTKKHDKRRLLEGYRMKADIKLLVLSQTMLVHHCFSCFI